MRLNTDRQSGEPDLSGENGVIQPAPFKPVVPSSRRLSIRLRIGAGLSGAMLLSCALVTWFVFSAKSVSVATDPEDAEVSIGGLAIHLADRVLIRPGRYPIRITAPGYLPLTRTLSVGEDQNQRVVFSLVRLPGHLLLTTEPAGARIEIDGAPRGRTPRLVRDLPPGPHRLRVSHDRYLPREESIAIEGKGVQQHLALALTPAWAEVTISSKPAGARVEVDGKFAGTTPLTAQVLRGSHTLRVQRKGYRAWTQPLRIASSEPVTLPEIRLEPADAVVVLASRPGGAGVTVNRIYRGRTPVELAIPPGEPTTLHLYKQGYRRASRELTLQSGEERHVSVDLTPVLATVEVSADPADATLYVDGVAKGRARQILRLTTRPHRIAIRKTGYRAYETIITPHEGIAEQIRVTLMTLGQARLAMAKPLIQTAAGHTLKLFRPQGDFTMGASRREPGRRANEIQRRVRLTRPFYLALHEVTNRQFKAYQAEHFSGRIGQHPLDTPQQPVVNVSWEEAALYCNWLSRKDSLPPFYRVQGGRVVGFNPDSRGYRLPTEAEWAWAARIEDGGKPSRFPWGEAFPPALKSGNYADRSAAGVAGHILRDYQDGFTVSAPVGSFPPNAKGLFDLGGNAAEWVHDFYAIAVGRQGVVSDPMGPPTGQYHVIRGAGWAHGTLTELRLSFRDYGSKGRDDVGFRIARYLE